MSFGDIYSAPPGSLVGSSAPGLPPINLPEGQPLRRQPLKVTVRPQPREPEISPWAAQQKRSGEEPLEPEPDISPWAASQPESSKENTEQIKQANEISRTEAAERGLGAGISFGGAPALEGLAAASLQPAPETPTGRASGAAAYRPIQGFINLLREHDAGLKGLITGPGPATKAYRQAREEAQAKLEASREQHPLATFGGEIAGSILAPAPGTAKLAQGATLPTRLLRGAVTGGTAGALYGAGTAASHGTIGPEGDWEQALEEILGSAGAGSLFGSAFHGAVGPRVRPASSAGQEAAATAERIGAPIPKGLASDNTAINSATAGLRSVPLFGSRISNAVDATQRAAGRVVGNIASGTRGAPPNRALAGGVLREALENYKEANNAQTARAYDLLKQVSDTHLFAPRDNLKNAVQKIISRRRGTSRVNPEAGLEDYINIYKGGKGGATGGGISFQHLQRVRNDLGQRITFFNKEANPGFSIGDLRMLYGALSKDMEVAVRHHAKFTSTPDEAARYLRMAHEVAKEMIARNQAAQRIINLKTDEGVAGALVNAASERGGGNLKMLSDLRAAMPRADFEHISGVLLNELGHNASTGEFSLRQFVTGWDKISDGAKRELFSPQHLRDLEDIFKLGQHIKGALRESNTSHTSNVLIMFDLVRDAIVAGSLMAAGTFSVGTAAGGVAAAVPGVVLAHWLASPSKAASMAKWIRAYRGLTLGIATPARRAVFNIATRNLANTLGVPAEQILKRVVQENGAGAATPQRQALPAR